MNAGQYTRQLLVQSLAVLMSCMCMLAEEICAYQNLVK